MVHNPISRKRYKPKKYGARQDKGRDADRYCGYLSLKLEHDGIAWFTARGVSMLSVFWPKERVQVSPLPDVIAPGQIAVFSQGAKLTAHRIIGPSNLKDHWITKGDTLAHFDKPLPHSSLIGTVAAVNGWRGKRKATEDAHAALLSSNLACKLCGHRQKRPSTLKYYLYVVIFLMLFPFRRRPFILNMLRNPEALPERH